MYALRWFLGITLAVLGTGVGLLVVFADAFRRSFGASENNPVPLVMLLFAGMLLFAALVFPGNRLLLHSAAVAALGLAAGCVWQIVAESAIVLWPALGWLGLWFAFYAKALRAPQATG